MFGAIFLAAAFFPSTCTEGTSVPVEEAGWSFGWLSVSRSTAGYTGERRRRAEESTQCGNKRVDVNSEGCTEEFRKTYACYTNSCLLHQ